MKSLKDVILNAGVNNMKNKKDNKKFNQLAICDCADIKGFIQGLSVGNLHVLKDICVISDNLQGSKSLEKRILRELLRFRKIRFKEFLKEIEFETLQKEVLKEAYDYFEEILDRFENDKSIPRIMSEIKDMDQYTNIRKLLFELHSFFEADQDWEDLHACAGDEVINKDIDKYYTELLKLRSKIRTALNLPL